VVTLNGGNTDSFGAFLLIQRNGVNKALLGTESAINGGASDDLMVYSTAGIEMWPVGAKVGEFTATGLNGCAIGATTPAAATVTTLGITQGAVISGTYTPTLTAVTNVAATTSAVCQYMRVGNVVTVSGRVNIDPTSASTTTSIRISLPVASNFAAVGQCVGSGTGDLNFEPLLIYGDTTNDAARLDFVPLNNANQLVGFHFTYLVV
jgi:hypothetical protein